MADELKLTRQRHEQAEQQLAQLRALLALDPAAFGWTMDRERVYQPIDEFPWLLPPR